MNKTMLLRCFGILGVCALVGNLMADNSGTARSGSTKVVWQSDLEHIQGAWKFISLEFDGKPYEPRGGLDRYRNARWNFEGNCFVDGVLGKGKFTLDSDKVPHRIALKFDDNPDEACNALYRLEGDVLEILTTGRTDAKFPTRFTSEDRQFVLTLRASR